MFTGLLNTFFFLSLLRSAPSSTLFTYTTLFRSRAHRKGVRLRPQRRRPHLVPHPDGRCPRVVPTAGSIRRADAPREVSAQRGLPSAGVREPAQRVVLEVFDQGHALGTARRQEDRDQGQRVRGRIPMMNGSAVLEGYVPDVDATLVTRILDAGGEIVGKAVCEHLCFSGGSHTSDTGPVLNPHDPKRSAGGSSSGSAALVVARECDMAIGGDQGGSSRIPSSYSGAVGLKPTYGLVPYTGVFPIELTLDHTGPIARTAADCALLLEAIAGADGLDPRQSGAVRT